MLYFGNQNASSCICNNQQVLGFALCPVHIAHRLVLKKRKLLGDCEMRAPSDQDVGSAVILASVEKHVDVTISFSQLWLWALCTSTKQTREMEAESEPQQCSRLVDSSELFSQNAFNLYEKKITKNGEVSVFQTIQISFLYFLQVQVNANLLSHHWRN